MRGQQECPGVGGKHMLEGLDGVNVKMVGWLIYYDEFRPLEGSQGEHEFAHLLGVGGFAFEEPVTLKK